MNDLEVKQAEEFAGKFTDALSETEFTMEQAFYITARIVADVSINAFEDEEHARSFIDAIKSQTLNIMIKGEYKEVKS